MNARQFLELQDAYQGVYESYLEPNFQKREENNKKAIEDMKKTKAHKDMVATVRKKFDEEVETDVFTQVLEYLVAEGYAYTNENALVIMANMSEEWKQSIVEARVDDGKSKEDKRKIRTARAGRAGVNLPNSSLHTGDIDRRDAHRTIDDLNKDAKDIRKGRLNLPQFQGTTGRERVAQVKKEKGIR